MKPSSTVTVEDENEEITDKDRETNRRVEFVILKR
jgi:hypothetical protein